MFFFFLRFEFVGQKCCQVNGSNGEVCTIGPVNYLVFYWAKLVQKYRPIDLMFQSKMCKLFRLDKA